MNPKEKAKEMVSKQFDIIAKASNYKGLKKEGEKKFYAIENVAKKCALINVNEIKEELKEWGEVWMKKRIEHWEEVEKELNKL